MELEEHFFCIGQKVRQKGAPNDGIRKKISPKAAAASVASQKSAWFLGKAEAIRKDGTGCASFSHGNVKQLMK